MRDLKLIPADEVPPGYQRRRKGIYEDVLSSFIKGTMDIAYIESESNAEAKNFQVGLFRAIEKRKMLIDQLDFSVKIHLRRNPPRVYLEKIREDRG